MTVEDSASPAPVEETLLFTTRTCPNCKAAKRLLDQRGIAYREVLAEEDLELAGRYGVLQAPTLVAERDSQAVILSGLSEIRKFVEQNTVANAV